VLSWSIKYEALSYVGGAPSPWDEMPRMLLDEAYYLKILPSLDIALRHLRSPDVPRTLWVDSICINQQDIQEKSTQVSMMQEIYAGAEIVNVWLGPAQEDASMGMDVLRYLAQSTLDDPAPWARMPELGFLSGFREVIKRDWFDRIWVVQEAAVSQKAIMMCGRDSFQWTNDPAQLRKFIRRVKYAAISPQWEQAGLSKVNIGGFLQVLNMQMQHIERQRSQGFAFPPDILDIAFELRHRKASDPRDKLFAIMGLVDQQNRSTF
jgi:hypothetical protein